MWSEAFEALARAERMQRQFFQPAGAPRRSLGAAGRRPRDRACGAGAGRAAEVDIDEVKAVISGGHVDPVSGHIRPEMQTATIHGLELPQGQFERRIRLRGTLRYHSSIGLQRLPVDYAAEVGGREWLTARRRSEETPRPAPSPPLPPDALIIVPVRGMVLFPGTALPIALGRPRSIMAAQSAVREQKPVGIVMQRNAEAEDPLPVDLHRMGTVANIVRYITAPEGAHHLVCQGEQRFRVVEYLNGWPFFVGAPRDSRTQPIVRRDRSSFCPPQRPGDRGDPALAAGAERMLAAIQGVDSPGALADLVATLHGRDAG